MDQSKTYFHGYNMQSAVPSKTFHNRNTRRQGPSKQREEKTMILEL